MKRNCLLSLCWLMSFSALVAQNNIATLSLGHIEETHMQQSIVINQDTVLTLNYPEAITGLSISGTATFNHASNSLVRITLQDDYNTEWLVYELFPLLADSNTVSFSNVAFETSVLDNVTAQQLNIKIINASLQLDEINTTNQAVASYSMQQSRAMQAQSSYIIDRLNENLEKRNIPWRAGETSISQMTYEEKKAMFGGEVPNLGGFEYYKGGIFVMPDYEPATNDGIATAATTEEEEDPYVKEWDWRNRHGKNWMTPVKSQGGCNSCWAFSTIALIESYINLYYNQQINYNLSEQELVSCAADDPNTDTIIELGCNGGYPLLASMYIKQHGIVEEECFTYTASNNNCDNKCLNPSERINIQDYHTLIINTTNELKNELIKAPVVAGITSWNHSMLLVGYRSLQENDTIWMTPHKIEILREGNPLIGTSAWIFKNSHGYKYGANDGYYYIVINPNEMSNMLKISGKITSQIYTDNDIVTEDKDNDGYYVWGVGEKPASLPSWIPNTPDGDDMDDDYGPLNEYGYPQPILFDDYTLNIGEDNSYSVGDGIINRDIVVKGLLTTSGTIHMHKDATITVEPGGTMIVEGGVIHKANIILKPGANFTIRNGGKISLQESDTFDAQLGSIVNIENGAIDTY